MDASPLPDARRLTASTTLSTRLLSKALEPSTSDVPGREFYTAFYPYIGLVLTTV